MKRVICIILAVAIEDLEVRLGNSNLLLGKNAIRFELLTQKGQTGKQTADALCYKY